MTPAELEAIEARANAATPGPWVEGTTIPAPGYSGYVTQQRGSGPWVVADVFRADAAFIASARTDIPALVAEVRRLQEELDRIYRSALSSEDGNDFNLWVIGLANKTQGGGQ